MKLSEWVKRGLLGRTEMLKEIERLKRDLLVACQKNDVMGDDLEDANRQIERLLGLIADPQLLALTAENNTLDLSVRCPHWASKAIAMSFADTFGEAANFSCIEIGPMPNGVGTLIVTVQRKDGTTPLEKWTAAEQRVAELEAELATCKLRFDDLYARLDQAQGRLP
jgi:hypothetical protein